MDSLTSALATSFAETFLGDEKLQGHCQVLVRQIVKCFCKNVCIDVVLVCTICLSLCHHVLKELLSTSKMTFVHPFCVLGFAIFFEAGILDVPQVWQTGCLFKSILLWGPAC